MFKDTSAANRAKADQLLEAAIETAMAVAAEVDDLDEDDAVFAVLLAIIKTKPPAEVLAMAVAGLSVRLRRVSTRAPVPSPE